MHVDDRIFGEWASPLTIGLGYRLDIQLAPCNILLYMQSKLQTNGKSD